MGPDTPADICGDAGWTVASSGAGASKPRAGHETPPPSVGTDPWPLDIGPVHNPQVPAGVTAVHGSALAAARTAPAAHYWALRAAVGWWLGFDGRRVIPAGGGRKALRLALATRVGAGDEVRLPTPTHPRVAHEVTLHGATPRHIPAEDLQETDPSSARAVLLGAPDPGTGVRPGRPRAVRPRAGARHRPPCSSSTNLSGQETMAGTEGTVVVASVGQFFGRSGLPVGVAVARDGMRERLDAAGGLGTLSRRPPP